MPDLFTVVVTVGLLQKSRAASSSWANEVSFFAFSMQRMTEI